MNNDRESPRLYRHGRLCGTCILIGRSYSRGTSHRGGCRMHEPRVADAESKYDAHPTTYAYSSASSGVVPPPSTLYLVVQALSVDKGETTAIATPTFGRAPIFRP